MSVTVHTVESRNITVQHQQLEFPEVVPEAQPYIPTREMPPINIYINRDVINEKEKNITIL